MSDVSGANLLMATKPFGDVEIQTQDNDWNCVGFRADSNYYESFPKRRFAIRLALTEFDVLALMGDVPPPRLYVFVTRVSESARVIEPMYRGEPFWKEDYCGNFLYAMHSDDLLFAILLHCKDTGGMFPDAKTQFEQQRQFVANNRSAHGLKTSLL